MNAYEEFEQRHGAGFEILFETHWMWPDGAYAEAAGFMFGKHNDEDQRRNLEARRRYWTKRRNLAATAFDALREKANSIQKKQLAGAGSIESDLRMWLMCAADRDALFATHKPQNVGRQLRAKIEQPFWDSVTKEPNQRLELHAPASEITLALLRGLRQEVQGADDALLRLEAKQNPPKPAETQERYTQHRQQAVQAADEFGEAMKSIPDV